jgi:Tfp pilus assembly protein PilO
MDIDIEKLDRICLIALLVVFVTLGSWVIVRNISEIGKIRNKNQLMAATLKDLASAETSFQKLNLTIADKKKKVKLLHDSVPNSAEIGAFFQNLDILVKKRQMTLESFKPLTKVEERRFNRIPIRLITRGNFENIFYFVRDLETMNRFVELEKVHLSKADNSEECKLDMTASIFERRD